MRGLMLQQNQSDWLLSLPYMGEQGPEMLALWKAQIEWLALTKIAPPLPPRDLPDPSGSFSA
jgi:hypothetical protein